MSAPDEQLAAAVRATLAAFYADGEFNHKAFLDEMTARKGKPLTKGEQRDLAKLVSAFVQEQS